MRAFEPDAPGADPGSLSGASLQAEVAALKLELAELKRKLRQIEKGRCRSIEAPSVSERPLVKDILLVVCRVSHQSPLAIVSERREALVMRPRQLTCWLARRFTRHSLTEIGICLHRDHTSILHSVRRLDQVVAAMGQSTVQDTPEAWARLILSVDPWPRESRHA